MNFLRLKFSLIRLYRLFFQLPALIIGNRYADLDFCLPSQRGNDRRYNHFRALEIFSKFNKRKPSNVLIIGCGDGCDVRFLRTLFDGVIVGVDLIDHSPSWKMIESEFSSVIFIQADISQVASQLGQFDVIISDAVLEHVSGFHEFMRSVVMLSAKKSIFYAGWGPLWWGHGGDHMHVSEEGLFHLVYDEKEIDEVSGTAVDQHSERIWVERSLLSFLACEDYFRFFEMAGYSKILSMGIRDRRLSEGFQGVGREIVSKPLVSDVTGVCYWGIKL